jgi:ankyrin repeat protein
VVDHAVRGRDPATTLAVAVRHGARAPAHGHQLLRAAADAGQADVVAQLLAIGADATVVTPGRWVLDRACARLLLDAGADVNHAPTKWQSWIWISCTGNNGRRDDPGLVEALLDAGADLGARAFGRTALESAQKAGFHRTVQLLVDRGANAER